MTIKLRKMTFFFISIGDVQSKKACIAKILVKGGDCITLIHPTAQVPSEVKIGKGCMIGSYVGIGVETTIGDFCMIQSKAIVGHDVKVGDFCRIDCNVVIIAGVEVGNDICIHTSSVINHNVHLGDGATVGIRERYPDAHIISMNTDDYKGVIDKIVQSRLIISSSLHGVILADAYGVPSVWYRGLIESVDFKYKDYYASTGRWIEMIPTCIEEAMEIEPLPLPDLRPLQKGLIESFPYDLWDN